MAPCTQEQQARQEAAAAAGYSQLPGTNSAVLHIAGPTGQQFHPAAAPPPGCAAPQAYTPYPPYPPQQYSAAPTGYPHAPSAGAAVTGYPAASFGHHMPPMSVSAAPVQGSPAFSDQEPCGCCTVGWVLFGVGWLFPICWVVGAFLPFCSKNRHDRRAAIASSIMVAISVVAIVLAVAIPIGVLASAAEDGTLTTSQNGYSVNGNSHGYNNGQWSYSSKP